MRSNRLLSTVARQLFLFVVFLFSSLILINEAMADIPPTPMWQASYDGFGGSDYPVKIITDSAGNSYVTGSSSTFSGSDFVTIKYDPNGNRLWVARYDYEGVYDYDRPTDLAVDQAGNVYVTGESFYSFATVKYDSAGNQMWVQRYSFTYNPYDNKPAAIATDNSGNIYVTGYACVWIGGVYGGTCEDHDYITIKYAPDGSQLWLKSYDQGIDIRPYDTDKALALVLDNAGNVYVTGTSRSSSTTIDIATVKYDSDGNQLWVKRDPGGYAPSLAVDTTGRLHLADIRHNGVNYDLIALKYDTDGTVLWERSYNNGYDDFAREIAVDTLGNVYIAGSSQRFLGGITYSDFVTLKYDSTGTLLWTARYGNAAGASIYFGAKHLAVDTDGNSYVTGNTPNVTIKYSPAGAQLWAIDGGNDIALDGGNNLFVAGNAAQNNGDFLTSKYPVTTATADFSLSSSPTLQAVSPGSGATYNLTVTSTNSFSDAVSLSCAVFPVTPNASCNLAPSTTTPPANGSSTSTLTVSTTASVVPGTYTITITGVSSAQTATTAVTLGISNADLTMTQLSPGVTEIRAGDILSVVSAVQNTGTAGAGTFFTRYRLSVNAVYGDADDVVIFAPIRTIDSLAAGSIDSGVVNLTVPNTLAAGDYHLCAFTDSDAYVIESNETNNTLCIPVTVTLPDLVVSAVSAGVLPVNAGAPLTVSFTITNQGGAAPPALNYAGLYLSADSVIAIADSELAAINLTPLAGGDSESQTLTVTIPGGIIPGTYYIGAITDPFNTIVESNESNNALAGPQVTITSGASDLVMNALSGPANGTTGGQITISDTVANQGTGSPARDFSVRFYLSTDALITASDFGLGSRSISPLAASATDSGVTIVSIPAGLATGTYYLGAITDAAQQVPESNETNNAFTGATISITSDATSFAPTAAWTERYTGTTNVHARPIKTITDGAGNIYVLGVNGNNVSNDFVTLKYDPTGNLLWQAIYDSGIIGGGGDTPYDMAVDTSGNVYVTGTTCVLPTTSAGPLCINGEYITLKYDSLGNQLWLKTYNSGIDATIVESNSIAAKILLDQSGNSYVAGVTHKKTTGGSHPGDFITIKYDPSGNEIWLRQAGVTAQTPHVVGLNLDQANDLYLMIQRIYKDIPSDYRIIKYDAAGNELWMRATDERFDAATVDSAGNIYVTGPSKNVTLYPNGYYTYKYDANGSRLWSAFYSAGGLLENPTAIATDSNGNVFVTGESFQGLSGTAPETNSLDFATVKYDANGTEQWVARYTRGNANTPLALTIDSSGNSFVTGRSNSGFNYDFAAIKYDPQGNQLWEVRYDNKGLDLTVPANMDGGDSAQAIALDTDGNVIVAGSSQNSSGDLDIATIKYIPSTSAPSLSDLAISALTTTTTSAAPGGWLDLSNTVTNTGAGNAGTFVVSFHLSSDTAYGGADDIAFSYGTVPFNGTPASWRVVAALDSGQSSAATAVLMVPTTAPQGNYYLCAKADVYDASSEVTEGNNTSCSPATITVSSLVPVISSVSPVSVRYGLDASQAITINGANFVIGSTITVGSLTGTVVAGSTATATTPFVYATSGRLSFWWPNTSLTQGSYDVSVTLPSGSGGYTGKLPSGFTVAASQPVIYSTSPATVTYGITASQSVTISGANFINGATITVGTLTGTTVTGSAATATVRYVYTSSTNVKFWWPNTTLAPGNYTVTVTNPAIAGGLSTSLTNSFIVAAPQPTISSVTSATVTYGIDLSKAITINGSNFVSGATVSLGSLTGTTVVGSAATASVSYVFVSSTRLSVWWNNTSLAPGNYTVAITNPATAGGLTVSLPNSFTVTPPQPAITSVSLTPVTYGVTTSRAITIYGSNFVTGATITVGSLSGNTVTGSSATASVKYVRLSATQLQFWWPNNSLIPGAYTVTVANPVIAGGLSTSLSNSFTVSAPLPAITSISPATVTYGLDVSKAITINGSNFVNGATVSIGSLAGTTVTGSAATTSIRYVYVSSTRLSVWWPNNGLAPGAYTVAVTNPTIAGGLAVSLTASFTVNPAQPTVTSLSLTPVVYGSTSSRSITINGTNFLLGSTITIQGPATLSGTTVSGSIATSAVKFVYTSSANVKFWWANTSLPVGTYNVTVTNPAPAGGLSATLAGGFVVQ